MVTLRNFYSSNITKKYINWLKDKTITKHTSINSKLSYAQIKNYVKKHQNNKNQKLYRIFYKKKHVGNIRICKKYKNEMTIGILIGEKKYQNMSIGTKSIQKLIKILKQEKIKTIIAYVSKKNKQSVKFFKKNNFCENNNVKYFLKIKRNTYSILKLNI